MPVGKTLEDMIPNYMVFTKYLESVWGNKIRDRSSR